MGRGRPTKLTPEIQRVIVSAIAKGNTREVAAAAAGIGRTTLFTWMSTGSSATHGPYRDFLNAVKKAESLAVMSMVGIVRHAAGESWQAAAWWLERRYPDEWGRKDRIELETIVRREAEKVAEETGLSVEDIVAAVEAIVSSR